MSSHSDDDRGSVSALVVCLCSSLVLLGLYLHDTARVIDEYARISDVAGNAARVGAQSITGIRAGDPRLDTHRAASGARRFMEQNDVNGTVGIDNGWVIVDVEATVEMASLKLFGIAGRRVRAHRVARLVSG